MRVCEGQMQSRNITRIMIQTANGDERTNSCIGIGMYCFYFVSAMTRFIAA